MSKFESKLNLVIDAQDNASGELRKVEKAVDNVAQSNQRLAEIDKRLAEIRKQEISGMSEQRQELAKLRDERKALLDTAKQSAAAEKAARQVAAAAAMKGVESAKQLAAAEREIMRELNDLDIALKSNVANLEGVAKAQAALQDAESRMDYIRQQSIDALEGEAKAVALLAEQHRKAVEEVKRLEKAEKDAAASVKKAEQEATAARVASDKAQAEAAKAAAKAAEDAAEAARREERAQNANALTMARVSERLKGMELAKRKLADVESQQEFARKQAIQSLDGEARELAELAEKQKAAKKAVEDLAEAEKKADEARKHRNELIKSLGVTVLAGLTAAGAAFARYSAQIMAATTELEKMSQKTGVSVEQLSALEDLAKRSGAPIEALAETFGILQRKAIENPQAFTRLGISVRDAAGNVKAGNVLFAEMSDALNTIKDPAERAVIATGLIEDKYKDLAGAIKLGSKGINESKENLESLGAVTSTGFSEMVKRFNQSISDVSNGVKGAITENLAAVLPLVTSVTEGIANYQRNLVAASVAAKELGKRQDMGGWEKYAKGMWIGAKAYLGFKVGQDGVTKSTKELQKSQEDLAKGDYTIKGVDIKANEETLKRQKKLVEDIKTSTTEAMERISSVASAALNKQKGIATEFEGLVKRIRNASGETNLQKELDAIGRKAETNIARQELADANKETEIENQRARQLEWAEKSVEAAQKEFEAKATVANEIRLVEAKNYLERERVAQQFAKNEETRAYNEAQFKKREAATVLVDEVRPAARASIDKELTELNTLIQANVKAGADSDSEITRLRQVLSIIEESRRSGNGLFDQKEADAYAQRIKELANEASKAEAQAALERSASQIDALKKQLQEMDIRWSDASLKKAADDVIASLDEGLKMKEFAITVRPKLTDADGKPIDGAIPNAPSYDVGGAMPSNMGNSFYIKAHKGEVMQSKPAVDFYGQDFMLALNRREIDPAIFNGGNAAAAAMSTSSTVTTKNSLSIDLNSLAGSFKMDANTTQADVDEYIRALRRRQS